MRVEIIFLREFSAGYPRKKTKSPLVLGSVSSLHTLHLPPSVHLSHLQHRGPASAGLVDLPLLLVGVLLVKPVHVGGVKNHLMTGLRIQLHFIIADLFPQSLGLLLLSLGP